MSDSEVLPGQVLGRYELLLPIAKGGMARVWAARLLGTRGFRKIVAVKTIIEGSVDDTKLEQMFLEEAALASQIRHPNVVETLELGEHDGTLYLVMEWVDGEPLHHIIAHAAPQGGIPLPIAVNIVAQACRGLHAAHELRDENGDFLGVVHRDISPQNLLVTYSGTTKLVDFGIAKVTGRDSTLTDAGEVKGKFAYMSPEQVNGQGVDRRSDIFAVGVLLYMLTTGRHPFKGEHAGETVRNLCSDEPALAPSQIVEDYPRALEVVLLKALSKKPEERFNTAQELLFALRAALPEALEPSYDAKVADFLNQLLGHRSGERRRRIRLAEEHFDRRRPDTNLGGSTPSSGSLGAVYIDRGDSGMMSSERVAVITVESSRPPPRPTSARRSIPAAVAAKGPWAWPAAVSIVACAVAAIVVFGPRGSISREWQTAASPVPAVTWATAPRPAPVAVVAHAAAEPVPVPVPVPATLPSASASSEPALVVVPKVRDRRARKAFFAPKPSAVAGTGNATESAASATHSVTTASSAPVTQATPPAPDPAPAAPKINAWDPANFGGRY